MGPAAEVFSDVLLAATSVSQHSELGLPTLPWKVLEIWKWRLRRAEFGEEKELSEYVILWRVPSEAVISSKEIELHSLEISCNPPPGGC